MLLLLVPRILLYFNVSCAFNNYAWQWINLSGDFSNIAGSLGSMSSHGTLYNEGSSTPLEVTTWWDNDTSSTKFYISCIYINFIIDASFPFSNYDDFEYEWSSMINAMMVLY